MINGELVIESTTSIGRDIAGKFGEGARLYLKGIDNSGFDPVWLAKYTPNPDQTDLRISIGDDSNDRLVVGITHWDKGECMASWSFFKSNRSNSICSKSYTERWF